MPCGGLVTLWGLAGERSLSTMMRRQLLTACTWGRVGDVFVAAGAATGGSALTAVGGVHIRCCGHGCLWFRSYSDSLLKSAKVSKTLLPLHSVPRLGSACPHSGIDPWAAAMGHPWPSAANPASLPGYPRLNACVRPSWLTGLTDQDQKPEQDQNLTAACRPACFIAVRVTCSRCRRLRALWAALRRRRR